MLFVQALFEGVAVAFLAPVRQAIVRDVLDASDIGNGVALQQAVFAVARIIGSAAGGALAATAIGVGAVIAAVWVAGIVSRPRVLEIYIVASISFGLAVIMLGLAPTFLAALAVIAVLGAAEHGAFSLSMSLGMTYSHHAYDGRVQSLIFSSFSIAGIVSLPLGMLAGWIGIRQMLVLEGTIATVLVLIAYAHRVDARADVIAPATEELAPSFPTPPGYDV